MSDEKSKFRCIECGREMPNNDYGGVCEDCYVNEGSDETIGIVAHCLLKSIAFILFFSAIGVWWTITP